MNESKKSKANRPSRAERAAESIDVRVTLAT